MRFHDTEVDLPAIDPADDTFRITTNTDVSRLKRSIRGVGLIAPPLLVSPVSAGGAGGHRLIAGFRRVAACRDLGFARIAARVLPPETSERDCARLAVADNALQRSLNPIETSRALTLLSQAYPDPGDLAPAAGELGLPDNPALIRKLIPLCRLPRPLQSAILAETLSLSMARTLSTLESGLAVTLTRLFADLSLGLNKQREVLSLLQEIALREDRAMADLLRDDAIQSILSDPDADRGQRAGALRRYLRGRRYPAISRAEAAFRETAATLPLGQGIQLIPPRHFESPVYSLSIGFSSLSELTDQHRRIGGMLSHPALKTLLS
jgi:ParB family chromosome partitioning protein